MGGDEGVVYKCCFCAFPYMHDGEMGLRVLAHSSWVRASFLVLVFVGVGVGLV